MILQEARLPVRLLPGVPGAWSCYACRFPRPHEAYCWTECSEAGSSDELLTKHHLILMHANIWESLFEIYLSFFYRSSLRSWIKFNLAPLLQSLVSGISSSNEVKQFLTSGKNNKTADSTRMPLTGSISHWCLFRWALPLIMWTCHIYHIPVEFLVHSSYLLPKTTWLIRKRQEKVQKTVRRISSDTSQ